jgi:hypothetical protein
MLNNKASIRQRYIADFFIPSQIKQKLFLLLQLHVLETIIVRDGPLEKWWGGGGGGGEKKKKKKTKKKKILPPRKSPPPITFLMVRPLYGSVYQVLQYWENTENRYINKNW